MHLYIVEICSIVIEKKEKMVSSSSDDVLTDPENSRELNFILTKKT